MALKNSILFVLIFSCSLVHAQSKLPEFITKQDKRNIRYISDDGNYTYYQRSNGSLQFSTNYKVTQVLQLKENTQYVIHTTKAKKSIIATANELYHRYLSTRYLNTIYHIPYGTPKAKKIGEGIVLGIHGKNDEWVSFYNPFLKTITLKNLVNPEIFHKINIISTLDPFFTPTAELIDDDQFAYTDVNREGVYGIRVYKLTAKASTTFYKGMSNNKSIQLCANDKQLFIWEVSLDPIDPGTRITYIPRDKFNTNNQKFVYQSPENDLGSLVCKLKNDFLFFIKTFKSKKGKYTFDAVQVNLKDTKLKVLSDVNFATSLMTLDSKLLLPYQGRYYVLLGENNMTQLDLLKKKEVKKK